MVVWAVFVALFMLVLQSCGDVAVALSMTIVLLFFLWPFVFLLDCLVTAVKSLFEK